MVRQILFVPDSELIVPGRSGARAALSELEDECARQLCEALTETGTERVRVFASVTSQFNRPLPGFWVAERLLESAGYSGKIRNTAPTDDVGTHDGSHEELWMILGTGAASHGDEAPLIANANASNAEIDAQLEQALANPTAPGFEKIGPEAARAVGATLVEPAATAVRALTKAGATGWMPGPVFRQREFGVTYFAARWCARGERP
ncbi:MAG TPA: hypothetical protein VK030_04665 [Actinomycetales bacterium]|nr:hypothetical protein [Actinomycetales bacterium]